MEETNRENLVCKLRSDPEHSGIDFVEIQTKRPLHDYKEAMDLANEEASKHLGDAMLLSWYDRDRDFESPQHASECHLDSAIPGYVDYGVSHGAKLRIDFEDGRFVFFFLPLKT